MVDGTSMQPSLKNNQFVLVNKLAYLFHTPERGDVIVFHWPRDTNKDLIKRVIGLPGDVIVTTGSTVEDAGVVLNQPYISMPPNPIAPRTVVPPNDYVVMGYNRHASAHPRDWASLHKSY